MNRNVPHSFLPVLMVAMVFVGCASVGGNGYLGVLFTSEGFSTEAAAALIAVSGACLMVSKTSSTGLSSMPLVREMVRCCSSCSFIGGTGLLCLSDMGSSWLATAAAVMFGLGLSLGTVGISVWSMSLRQRAGKCQPFATSKFAMPWVALFSCCCQASLAEAYRRLSGFLCGVVLYAHCCRGSDCGVVHHLRSKSRSQWQGSLGRSFDSPAKSHPLPSLSIARCRVCLKRNND